MADEQYEQYIIVETAATIDDMAARLYEIQKDQGAKGLLIQSMSHAVNHENPNGPYEFIVVARKP